MAVEFVSVIITSFNDDNYLDRLFMDLSCQDLNGVSIEILHLEAGTYEKQRALKNLRVLGSSLTYFNTPGLGRTDALNKLMDVAQGELVIRLDARTHIPTNYVKKIIELSEITGAENVGGVLLPVGETQNQKFIAEVMKSPIWLGGAKFRRSGFTGDVDSVYLGAFNRQKIKVDYWFDDNGKISEDSELNFRIRRSGGRVVVDSSIIVEYFPRDGIKSFLRLCFNYGIGRGLFVLKHRTFSAFRQIMPPAFFLVTLILLVAGFFNSIYFSLCLGLIFFYLFSLTLIAIATVKPTLEIFKFVAVISGCHFFWSLGLIFSPLYKKK